MAAIKRKSAFVNQSQNKRAKSKHVITNSEHLPWKSVVRPQETGLDGDNGVLELEEVDDVEVIYEETEGGRVVKFNVVDKSEADVLDPVVEDQESAPIEEEPVEDFDCSTLLPNWSQFNLHPHLTRALHSLDFSSPTPIQAKAIPDGTAGRDVVGVAETGSGKTLAYGLPILQYALSQPRSTAKHRPLRALILTPTRELALQVSSHLNALVTPINASFTNPSSTEKRPPRVSVAAIVGGMSVQKQRRTLDRGVDVLVATPGRLWDILEDDDTLAKELRGLKFLVLDEADRMIEAGHFAELDNILRLTLREAPDDQIEPEFTGLDDRDEDTKDGTLLDGLQTFVFSATLSKDLQRNVKRKTRPKVMTGKRRSTQPPPSTLDDLLLRLDFRDPSPQVIDISPTAGVVSTLKESKIECLSSDKDVLLYYFLLRYPGRSLVFVSSIDTIRRLLPLFELLHLPAFPLHSQLEQRQRLKNLERFKTTPNSILLATDIAARGLDIPSVDHVIHYQIPRSADAYVHRCGRTARAGKGGFSMLMCAPEERRAARALLGSLGRQDTEIPELAIELTLLDKLRQRVQVARQIDQVQHKIKKQNHERNWMKEAAEAMEIDLDSDFASDDGGGEEKPSKQKRKAKAAKTASLKSELKRLLSQPLVAKGVSTRYITSGSRPIVDDLISGDFNENMLGVKKVEVGSQLTFAKSREKSRKVAKVEVDGEEWAGIQS